LECRTNGKPCWGDAKTIDEAVREAFLRIEDEIQRHVAGGDGVVQVCNNEFFHLFQHR